MIRSFKGVSPRFDETCFIAETAAVIGDVVLGPRTSVWYGAVVRGDEHFIRIGSHCNIQDNAVCHVTGERFPLHVGDWVTIGHGAVVHGCTIGNHCVVGMGAVVLDGATIGEGSIVAAGAVVTEGATIPTRSLVAGVPARMKKELTALDLERIDYYAGSYLDLSKIYIEEK